MVKERFDASGRHEQQSGQPALAGSVDVLVSAAVEDRERLVEVSRWWLTEARSRLCGALSEGLRSGLPTAEFAVGRIGAPELGGGNWSVSYTAERFEAVVASLSNGRGDAMAHLNAAADDVSAGDCCSAHIAVTVDPDVRPWVTFSLRLAYRLDDAGMIPVASQDDLVAFVRDFAELTEASFANIASDNSSNQTALETYLPRLQELGLMESPSVVRGYSWVTLVTANAVPRLGGVDGLESSGAFVEVAELQYGAALLRATRFFEEYKDSAVERVFRALAPVLPAGVPRRLSYGGLKQPQLIYKDAADAQD
ncbi:hypothetical protein EV646_111269 [Kribbella antiqua]|uniref:Uncharacterized protein n=1 Tax=Kribbella antiqua TaxID=2512217 RepID=A0A4R2IIP4_9ACTN|nr:hypothetical protein [Kribbella antiqua]TCO44076.1 hypothetical protein EV646_111269 [Kribbella antiqua]